MKRIGLTQRVEVVAAHGERRDCLDQNWARLLDELDMAPNPLSNAAGDAAAYLDELRLDGVILTGGNDLEAAAEARSAAPERDRFEFALLEHCFARRIPVLGVCRGMQVINAHLGGALSPVKGHVASRHLVSAGEGAPKFWPESFEVNSYHDFGIAEQELAKALVPAALDEEGKVEAFRHKDQACFGFMWHPEREHPFTSRDTRTLAAIFDEAFFNGMAR